MKMNKSKIYPHYDCDFLLRNLLNCRSMTMCQGSCDIHRGELQVVRVIDETVTKHHDWGFYMYCENAITSDVEAGLTVYIEDQEKFWEGVDKQRIIIDE